jgi:hypothetical protein
MCCGDQNGFSIPFIYLRKYWRLSAASVMDLSSVACDKGFSLAIRRLRFNWLTRPMCEPIETRGLI